MGNAVPMDGRVRGCLYWALALALAYLPLRVYPRSQRYIVQLDTPPLCQHASYTRDAAAQVRAGRATGTALHGRAAELRARATELDEEQQRFAHELPHGVRVATLPTEHGSVVEARYTTFLNAVAGLLLLLSFAFRTYISWCGHLRVRQQLTCLRASGPARCWLSRT